VQRHLQQIVRVSVKANVPGEGCVFGVAAQPPEGGVDVKCVAVKLLSLVEAQLEPRPTAPCEFPTVLHIELSKTDTLPPVHAVGAPQAQPTHAVDSSAPVPAVLRLGKSGGHALIPALVTQLVRPPVAVGAQT